MQRRGAFIVEGINNVEVHILGMINGVFQQTAVKFCTTTLESNNFINTFRDINSKKEIYITQKQKNLR